MVGDPGLGLVVGATLQLVWTGVLPVGAAPFPDGAVAGVTGVGVGAVLARSGVSPGLAAAAAVTAGLCAGAAGQRVTSGVRRLNVRYSTLASSRAEEGDPRGVTEAIVLGLVTRFATAALLTAATLSVSLVASTSGVGRGQRQLPLGAVGRSDSGRGDRDRGEGEERYRLHGSGARGRAGVRPSRVTGLQPCDNGGSLSVQPEDRTAGTLTRAERAGVLWRSLFLQAAWNPRGMQNVGFCFAMLPVLRRRGADKEARRAFLKRHLGFFNTNPTLASYVLGAAAAAEAAGADETVAGRLKKGLSSPLGMAGDALLWGALRPLAATVAVLLALRGFAWAPLALVGVYGVPHLVLKARGIGVGAAAGPAGRARGARAASQGGGSTGSGRSRPSASG